MRRARIAAVLFVLPLLGFAPAPARAVVPTPGEELAGYLTDVRSANGYFYGLTDTLNQQMIGLKVAQHSRTGYVGVYHSLVGSQYKVKLGVSSNLIGWSWVRNLAPNSSSPTIRRYNADGSYIVAYETTASCTGGTSGSCLRFLRYANADGLMSGSPTHAFTVPRTLSSCGEGSPNITKISTNTAGKVVLDVSFHYSADCLVDRQAKGTLVDFSTWSTQVDTDTNALFEAATPNIGGHLRDSDRRAFRGRSFDLYEAQLAQNDQSTWSAWLRDSQTNALSLLNVQTHGGSRSFGYPTVSTVDIPDGTRRVIVTYYIHPQGAAPGEAGELIFYHDYDTRIAAAGDISTTSISGQQRTSDLIVADPPAGVLALGDNQYNSGELSNFNAYYDPTWGRFKWITYSAPGNHDPCPGSGYDEYYNRAPNNPCWYSFDLGKWHFISLDSNRAAESQQIAFLEQDLAANTKKCVLAFWHHPRFSSGGTHGNNTRTQGFWNRLYNADADVILVGHEHLYERFGPQTPAANADLVRGIRQFTVGTGGAGLYQIGTIRKNSEVRHTSGLGVLRLQLYPWGYDWRFQSEAGNTFTDTGSDFCH